MRCRHTRASGCGEIRERLAGLCGGVLRRVRRRRHLERCTDCRTFAAEVGRQHAELGVLLAVAPSPGLKHSILSGAAAAGGSDAVGGSDAAAADDEAAIGRGAFAGGDGADGAATCADAAGDMQRVAARVLLALALALVLAGAGLWWRL